MADTVELARQVAAAIDRLHLCADQLTLVAHPSVVSFGDRPAGVLVQGSDAVSPTGWLLIGSHGRVEASGSIAGRGLCPECGSEPYDTNLETRPDMVECRNHCGTWIRPDADPAVTRALAFWQRRYAEADDARAALERKARGCLA